MHTSTLANLYEDHQKQVCIVYSNFRHYQLQQTISAKWLELLKVFQYFARHNYRRKHELSVEYRCLWGSWVVIPPKLQKYVLCELHVSHLGMVRMKSLHMTWKRWYKYVQHAKLIFRSQLLPSTSMKSIFQCIHIGFAGPFLGHMFLLVIDAHSKWLEVFVMSSTTSIKTIETVKSLFARYGLPEQIVRQQSSVYLWWIQVILLNTLQAPLY